MAAEEEGQRHLPSSSPPQQPHSAPPPGLKSPVSCPIPPASGRGLGEATVSRQDGDRILDGDHGEGGAKFGDEEVAASRGGIDAEIGDDEAGDVQETEDEGAREGEEGGRGGRGEDGVEGAADWTKEVAMDMIEDDRDCGRSHGERSSVGEEGDKGGIMSLDGEQEEGTMVLEEEGHGSVVDGGAGGEPRAEVHANGVGDHVSEVSSRPADALSSAKVTSMKVSVSRDNDDGECMRDVSKWLLEKKEWFGDKMKPSELLKSKKTILEWQSEKAIEQVCPAPAPNSLTICLFFSSPSLYIYIYIAPT